MSSSQEERDRLKEIYKDHYKAIKETKAKLASAQTTKRISDALGSIKQSAFMEDIDHLIDKVREKAYLAEAKVEQALDDQFKKEVELENEKIIKQQKAKSTLDSIKAEMGDVYDENEARAKDMKTKKTIGK
jgi:phage shock protein A